MQSEEQRVYIKLATTVRDRALDVGGEGSRRKIRAAEDKAHGPMPEPRTRGEKQRLRRQRDRAFASYKRRLAAAIAPTPRLRLI